jgi:hypothetical protein
MRDGGYWGTHKRRLFPKKTGRDIYHRRCANYNIKTTEK